MQSLVPEAVLPPAGELGVQLSGAQAERLCAFGNLLLKWNKVHNLTALTSPADVLSHHLLDSLSIIPELERLSAGRSSRILDVGAGGGLPGLPIAIACPGFRVTVIDRVQKKTAFMEQARVELAISNLEVVHGRVEDYRAPPFDVIVARAFAELAEMVRLTSHLLVQGGDWFAMKGVYPGSEVAALPATARVLRTVKLHVPLLGAERHLVVMGRRL
jgi:16S rRNA (guanine527-N7)-methyltransferase